MSIGEERADVIDLLINTLREHERSLDEAVNKISESAVLLRDAAMELITALTGEKLSPLKSPEAPLEAQGASNRAPSMEFVGIEEEEAGYGEGSGSDEDRAVLIEILSLIHRHRILSLTEISRLIEEGTRNWLAGFMAALEATGIVERRGTATHKLYTLTQRGREVLRCL